MLVTAPIFLIGLMGVGKTAVGARLGARLGVPFVDLDEQILERTGRTPADWIEQAGEPVFREREAEVLLELIEGGAPSIVATGGGAVLADHSRAALSAHEATVVWLDAPVEVLVERVTAGPGLPTRPLLGADPHAALSALAATRAPRYADAATVGPIDTSRFADADAAAVGVIDVLDPTLDPSWFRVPVRVDGGRSYPVIVGAGARNALASLVPDDVRRVAIVTQDGIDVEVDPGTESRLFTVPPGEPAKRLETVETICREMAAWGMTRRDLVVGVGGGVVTDLAGFIAAVYHRGIRVMHVSTTLLGQIDAAVGGKTGVNLPEGKNLVGAFWQPSAVLCDTEVLGTLPPREFRAGMGELAKYHFLGGGNLDELPLDERVAASVRIKAEVVAADEREGGIRAILNYGHTLAHALETAGSYDLRHGEAVAIGLRYAAEVAERLGRIDRARVDEHLRVLHTYDLPSTVPPGLETAELVALFSRDKKALDGLTFVLDGPNGVETVQVDDVALLSDALEAIRA